MLANQPFFPEVITRRIMPATIERPPQAESTVRGSDEEIWSLAKLVAEPVTAALGMLEHDAMKHDVNVRALSVSNVID